MSSVSSASKLWNLEIDLADETWTNVLSLYQNLANSTFKYLDSVLCKNVYYSSLVSSSVVN